MKDGIFRILAIGDVVGMRGTQCLKKHLWNIRRETGADFTLVNGENAAPGNGITPEAAEALLMAGADGITTGNHVYRRREIYDYLEDHQQILRPANYPKGSPGFGSGIFDVGGVRVLVMNLLGTVYMDSLENPFETAGRILEREKGQYDLAVCDFHGEATSEKQAFAYCFDGQLAAVYGTHTHVQTNDPSVLPGGTGFLSDLGMTGPENSVLGVKKELVIRRFLTKMPVRFEEETEGNVLLCGAVFFIDIKQKKTVEVQLLRRSYSL